MTNKFEVERLEIKVMLARVTDAGKSYTTYTELADAIGYPDAVGEIWTKAAEEKGRNANRLYGKVVRILAKGKHEHCKSTIYAIENEEGERFLIGEEGIEIIYQGMRVTSAEQERKDIRKAYAEGFEAGREFERKPFVSPKGEAQENRDRIVEQSKADIDSLFFEGNEGVGVVVVGKWGHYKVEFIVNKDKRTVVALLRLAYVGSGDPEHRGIAKCAPDDCFNVHIGKAIALRRALGYKVPTEYLNTPQPKEVRVGDITEFTNGRIAEVVQKDSVGGTIKDNKTKIIYSAVTFEKVRIIDDSRDEVGG